MTRCTGAPAAGDRRHTVLSQVSRIADEIRQTDRARVTPAAEDREIWRPLLWEVC